MDLSVSCGAPWADRLRSRLSRRNRCRSVRSWGGFGAARAALQTKGAGRSLAASTGLFGPKLAAGVAGVAEVKCLVPGCLHCKPCDGFHKRRRFWRASACDSLSAGRFQGLGPWKVQRSLGGRTMKTTGSQLHLHALSLGSRPCLACSAWRKERSALVKQTSKCFSPRPSQDSHPCTAELVLQP